MLQSTKISCLKLMVACYRMAARHPDITCAQMAIHLKLGEKTARRLRELFLAVVADAASATQTATTGPTCASAGQDRHVAAVVKLCATDHVAAGRVDPLELTWAVLSILLKGRSQTDDPGSLGLPPEAVNSGGGVGSDAPSTVEEPDWDVLLPRLDSFSVAQPGLVGNQKAEFERETVGGRASVWNGARAGGSCGQGGQSVNGSDGSHAELSTAHGAEPEDGRDATAAPVSSQSPLLPTASPEAASPIHQTLPRLERPKVQHARPKASKRAKPRKPGVSKRKTGRVAPGQIRMPLGL